MTSSSRKPIESTTMEIKIEMSKATEEETEWKILEPV